MSTCVLKVMLDLVACNCFVIKELMYVAWVCA